MVYTALRALLFVASFCLVAGAWWLVTRELVPFLIGGVVALLLSGLASYVLLEKQRVAFAQRIERRAERASSALEKMRSKED